MRIFIILLLLFNFLSSYDKNSLLKEASKLEKDGKYKEAMLIYKEIANNTYLEKTLEENSFKEIKVKEIPEEVKVLAKNVNTIEDQETMTTIEQMLASSFNLYPYKENYFFPISYDTKKRNDRKRNETKFQLSLKKPISHNFFGFEETFYFGYTQISYWQLYSDSSPFRETNYKPEFFVTIPYGKRDKTALKGFKTGFLHESNGQGEEESRSWNRIYLESYFQYKNLFIIPRVWYRIEEKDDDNPDIEDYLGYGDLTFMYPYKEHNFKLMFRNNLKSKDNRGFAQLDWTFPFFGSKNTFGHIQISNGYGDSLIDYDKDITRINFGISLSR